VVVTDRVRPEPAAVRVEVVIVGVGPVAVREATAVLVREAAELAADDVLAGEEVVESAHAERGTADARPTTRVIACRLTARGRAGGSAREGDPGARLTSRRRVMQRRR
jgi:hypothetical protein